MISNIFHVVIYNPLYNGLIYLFNISSWIDAGIAVIIFTIIIRLILFPLSKKSIVTQVRMKEIEPELAIIKKTVTDKQQQAIKTMELYRQKGVNPFSSILLLFIQLPVIYSLYYIFAESGLPVVNEDFLYSFVNVPTIDMHFIGLFDVSVRSFILSIIAAISQYLQLHFSLSVNNTPGGTPNPMQDMMKNMKYVFPVMIFFISYSFPAVVALYWTASSLFTLGQELVVRRHLKRHQPL